VIEKSATLIRMDVFNLSTCFVAWQLPGDVAPSNPMTGIAGCCACAVTGHAAARVFARARPPICLA
jgi:hypothetical protein